jgi:hypothetical protein
VSLTDGLQHVGRGGDEKHQERHEECAGLLAGAHVVGDWGQQSPQAAPGLRLFGSRARATFHHLHHREKFSDLRRRPAAGRTGHTA